MHLLLLYTTVLVILHKGYCFTQNNEENKIMYIRPDNGSNTTCPGQPCEPLDYYAGLTNYSNNACFIFISGLHTLSKSFTITNGTNNQLLGVNDTFSRNQTVSTEIQCNTSAGFIFENVEYLIIKNLKIDVCGQVIPANIYNNTSIPLSMQTAVALKNIFILTMYSTTIQDSSGYGMVVNGLYGNSTLDNCKLINNTGRDCFLSPTLTLFAQMLP